MQTHIPLGSWSKVRKCEICQPRGDRVIEEFDSERNILLPWWCTGEKTTQDCRHHRGGSRRLSRKETYVDRKYKYIDRKDRKYIHRKKKYMDRNYIYRDKK